jgi:hypothetical protein
MRVSHVVVCGLSGCTVFIHIISKTTRFSKKRILNTKCVFWMSLQILSETFLVLRKLERGMIKKKYNALHVKCPLFLSDFNEIWVFSTEFRKMLKYQISWKSVQWEPSCSGGQKGRQTDRQTGRHEDNDRFSHFAKAPKRSTFCPHAAFMCFVWISEKNPAVIFTYNSNLLVLIIHSQCVSFGVRTESLNTVQSNQESLNG